MGKIQNSLNSISGTAMIGAMAASKINDIKEADIKAGESAKAELPETKEALQGIEAELGTQYLETDNLKAEFEGIDQSNPMGRLQAVMKLSDIEAGERAIKNLEEKQQAKVMQIKRLEKTVAKAKKWTGGRD